MEIRVSFDGRNFKISPDPARVKAGTLVKWRFHANHLGFDRILWTVFFHHGSPFQFQADEFTTTTQSDQGQHTGTTDEMAPDTPGDYKYGVRSEDARTQHRLGEDDPRLLVTP